MKAKRWISILFAVVLVFSLIGPAYAAGNDYIVNGNFSSGNTGFSSDYNYVAEDPYLKNELYEPNTYGVGTNPSDYHYYWASYGDHTSGTGNMMIVNAKDASPSGDVWSQTVSLPAYNPASITRSTLYAGQNWDIGNVLVKYDNGIVSVKFELTDAAAIADGWGITQAHVAAAKTIDGIPHNKSGSPIPGQFPINETFAAVTETGWYDLGTWAAGVELCIAAHAKLEHAAEGHTEYYDFCMMSGADTDVVTDTGLIDAVVPTTQPWGSLASNVSSGFANCTDIAKYIWDANAATSYYADNGGMVDFQQTFNVIGTPTSASLKIAADNAFAYSINSGAEVAENLVSGWRDLAALGEFGYPNMIINPNPSGWGDVYSYDVLSSITSGSNVFNVTGVNADWNTTSWSVNPAAVVYKLCGTSQQYVQDQAYDEESGWGDGTAFPGSNWATCIHYTPTVTTGAYTYTFSFWAANSDPGNPAQLQVFVNGASIGKADLSKLPMTGGPRCDGTGVWGYFSFEVKGVSGPAEITIQNMLNVYGGDDFALDDISLKQN